MSLRRTWFCNFPHGRRRVRLANYIFILPSSLVDKRTAEKKPGQPRDWSIPQQRDVYSHDTRRFLLARMPGDSPHTRPIVQVTPRRSASWPSMARYSRVYSLIRPQMDRHGPFHKEKALVLLYKSQARENYVVVWKGFAIAG